MSEKASLNPVRTWALSCNTDECTECGSVDVFAFSGWLGEVQMINVFLYNLGAGSIPLLNPRTYPYYIPQTTATNDIVGFDRVSAAPLSCT